LRVTDGLLGNQETKWQETKDVSTGTAVHSANAYVTFKKPETINAVAIYEDNRGPVAAGDGVQEMVSAHYGVYIHEAKANKWSRVGYVGANMNLVNVFTFPPTVVDRIHYFWAGRPFSGATDGMVRMAELEAYSTEESDLGLDDAGGEGEEGGDGEIKMD
jgi:hypothetical protein